MPLDKYWELDRPRSASESSVDPGSEQGIRIARYNKRLDKLRAERDAERAGQPAPAAEEKTPQQKRWDMLQNVRSKMVKSNGNRGLIDNLPGAHTMPVKRTITRDFRMENGMPRTDRNEMPQLRRTASDGPPKPSTPRPILTPPRPPDRKKSFGERVLGGFTKIGNTAIGGAKKIVGGVRKFGDRIKRFGKTAIGGIANAFRGK